MELLVKEIVNAVNGVLFCGDENKAVTSVSTNSREIEEGALFVPIIGERVDGHRFIKGAFENGAAASFTSENQEQEVSSQTNCLIYVKDTLQALQALGAYYRSLFSIPLIGITGSVGKTTTKEMVAAALETKFHVLKTIGNMNSQIGLPLMMFYLDSSYDVAVIEMGMSEEGEMARLAKIAKPDMAVLTNIGVSHIGQLGSKENIRKEKLDIISEFEKENKLFLNGDDILLSEINQNPIKVSEKAKQNLEQTKCIRFGTNDSCDFWASDIKAQDGNTFFILHYPEGEEKIQLSVLGLHNVSNALAALSIGYYLGISPKEAKAGLLGYAPIAMRGQIFEHKGMYIIDDTYNASPDSMKSSISALLLMEQVERRIAVLADVLELGEVSYSCHYEVGQYIAEVEYDGKQVDEVVTVGAEARAIKEAVEHSSVKIICHSFDSNEEALNYLKSIVKKQDGILIKGSRGMHTDEIAVGLKNL